MKMNTSNGFQEDGPIHYTTFSQTDFPKKGWKRFRKRKCVMVEELYLRS